MDVLDDWTLVITVSFMGTLFASFILGVVSVQACAYFRRFSGDLAYIRRLIPFLCILPLVQLACVTQALYSCLIVYRGQVVPDTMVITRCLAWRLCVWQFIGVISSSSVQFLFVWRIRQLNKTSHIPRVMSLMVLVPAILGICSTASMTADISDNVWMARVNHTYLIPVWLGSNAVMDLSIAFVMAFYLKQKRTGFVGTDTLIARLVAYTLRTGFLASAASLTTFALIAANGFRLPIMVPGVPYGSFYTVVLLSNLLLRTRLHTSLPREEEIPEPPTSCVDIQAFKPPLLVHMGNRSLPIPLRSLRLPHSTASALSLDT